VQRCVLLTAALVTPLAATPRVSANYSLTPAIIDGGGLRAASASYTAIFSAGPGGAAAAACYTARGGFAGQLRVFRATEPPVLPDRYHQWAAANHLEGDNALPGQDPERDGFTNLQEFAFGTDPNAATGPLTIDGAGKVTNPKGGHIVYLRALGESRVMFSRRRNFEAAGLIYTVQFSIDLIEWEDYQSEPVPMECFDLAIDVVYVPFVPLPNSRCFFRIGIQLSE
jgi:hypothetical protein